MTQIKEGATSPAVTERAEQIVNRAGEQLGRLAGQALLRFQQARQSLNAEADDMDALEPTSTKRAPGDATTVPSATEHPPATARAEELVDQFAQRVGHWAITSNLRTRRMLARLREDAEDIWVEAHGMRGTWKSKR